MAINTSLLQTLINLANKKFAKVIRKLWYLSNDRLERLTVFPLAAHGLYDTWQGSWQRLRDFVTRCDSNGLGPMCSDRLAPTLGSAGVSHWSLGLASGSGSDGHNTQGVIKLAAGITSTLRHSDTSQWQPRVTGTNDRGVTNNSGPPSLISLMRHRLRLWMCRYFRDCVILSLVTGRVWVWWHSDWPLPVITSECHCTVPSVHIIIM